MVEKFVCRIPTGTEIIGLQGREIDHLEPK